MTFTTTTFDENTQMLDSSSQIQTRNVTRSSPVTCMLTCGMTANTSPPPTTSSHIRTIRLHTKKSSENSKMRRQENPLSNSWTWSQNVFHPVRWNWTENCKEDQQTHEISGRYLRHVMYNDLENTAWYRQWTLSDRGIKSCTVKRFVRRACHLMMTNATCWKTAWAPGHTDTTWMSKFVRRVQLCAICEYLETIIIII